MKIDSESVRKILVIKLRAIGDVVLSTVVLENLRAAFPRAQIDFLTEKPSRDVLEGNPFVDEVVTFDPKHDGGLGLIAKVRKRGYDLVIDLFGNPRSALVTLMSGAKFRVGFPFGWRKHCYNVIVAPRGGEVHNTEFNLDALRRIEVPVVSRQTFFPLSENAERFAEAFFAREQLDGKFTVALNPGGGWYTKRWPIPQYAALGDALVEKYSAKVLIIWGPAEHEDAQQLNSRMRHPSIILPQTSLKQLAAIFKRCSLVVTNDSGPMHIAAAVGTPVVAIFGPTNPELQGPIGDRHEIIRNEKLLCLGCNLTECPIENPCMLELSVENVLGAVRRAIEKNKMSIELTTTS